MACTEIIGSSALHLLSTISIGCYLNSSVLYVLD